MTVTHDNYLGMEYESRDGVSSNKSVSDGIHKASEEVIQEFYRQLDDTVRILPKRDITIVSGELNHLTDGKYGLGNRNGSVKCGINFAP
ncbi:unnamed protein product [Pieris brassicae]|uniref:Uncharacterized protein n=1 Tax=Pieris brassicae TaxID=7116 RepID=A0A9P0TVM2_PIEBR|nr:unnamed protein product [Pieris brassicae]